MGRRRLSFSDRADIAVGILAGWTDRQIGAGIGRDQTIIRRERGRNSTKTRGYHPVSANCAAERKGKRPQARKIYTDPVIAARVKADLAS
ncbi:helix-turn-helix domain-containing protein [Arthrobacter sp. H35-D1]|uniref:helix-turn-helix domain-containing protein n=1 Tax=Arthrobacter sp. H35-D1 TaxID=3046202 RepID=UPI0024B8C97A|nr:helix-turn-helix domain-containing protein [Arthrobacter sp. H35-D1]MDJ0312591.1 helix-turn-helix domain-containing protein [Arthrobacter sp. H35-D1]